MLFKLIVQDYNKPVVSVVDQLINTITKKKPIKYISNGIELKTNFTEHYFNILDMEKGKLYDREMIFKPGREATFLLSRGHSCGLQNKM